MRVLRRDDGNPAAALAIIAAIFAIGFTIKLLPPATRQPLLDPISHRDLPSRALLIWSPGAPPAVQASRPRAAARIVVSPPRRLVRRSAAREGGSAQREGGEPTGDVPLTFDRDPGEAPLIPASPSTPVALPMAVGAVHPEIEISNSLLVMPFTKTRSALRVAFLKTGSAIRTAASGTAGVFVSNP